MNIWLILAFIFASLEALAVWKNQRRLEFIAKPGVMICLFLWLHASTGLQDHSLWFGIGILFSLAGDIFLLWPNRMFLFGLIAFLFAHISYIIGFKDIIVTASAWSLILIVIIMVSATRVIRRIASAMRAKEENRLVNPVILYASVISVMLYAAMLTISEPTWKTSAALFVSTGAFLFYISDLILAWNKFVSPIEHGRLYNIVTYHLGQIGLIAGIISQFR